MNGTWVGGDDEQCLERLYPKCESVGLGGREQRHETTHSASSSSAGPCLGGRVSTEALVELRAARAQLVRVKLTQIGGRRGSRSRDAQMVVAAGGEQLSRWWGQTAETGSPERSQREGRKRVRRYEWRRSGL
jgi:hypothetical protein